CIGLWTCGNPWQKRRSAHFVLAKLRRDVLKHGVAGGLRYGFGGLHQPVEFVSGQSQSQLVQWGHGKRSTKNKNAATGLWFSDCISPFRRMHRPDSAGAAGVIFRYGPFPSSDRWPEMQEGSPEPAISRA